MLVSIIVAVYNAERFIHKCVDSLLGQTYPHIEVILVDDNVTSGDYQKYYENMYAHQ